MAKAPAFQLYAADFYMDTIGWSCEEVGLYFRLLMAEWVNGPLPDDPVALARSCQISTKKFVVNFNRLATKFVKNEEGYLINKRLENTRLEQEKYSESRKNNAKKRWDDKNAHASSVHMHSGCPSSSSSTSIKEEKTYTSKHAVSTCPHQEIISLYHETLPELPPVKIWNPQRQAILRARWAEDKARQNLEWWKTYFLKVKESQFLTGKQNGFKADLEWIIRPKNMPKVIEGRYDNRGASENESSIDAWARKKQAELEAHGTV